jgi:hypothetical protein
VNSNDHLLSKKTTTPGAAL